MRRNYVTVLLLDVMLALMAVISLYVNWGVNWWYTGLTLVGCSVWLPSVWVYWEAFYDDHSD